MSDTASLDPSFPHAAPVDGEETLTPSLRAAARLFMYSLMLLGIAIALVGDAFMGIMFFSTGVIGWRGFQCGTIRSLFALSAVIAIYIWAVPWGKQLAIFLRSTTDLPLVPSRYLSILIVAAGLLLGGEVVGWLIYVWHRRRRHGDRKARVMGMFAGAVQGAVMSLTCCLAVVAAEPPARMALSFIMDDHPWAQFAYNQLLRIRAHTTQAPLGRRLSAAYASQHKVLELGGALAIISRYPGAVQGLKSDALIRELIAGSPALHRIVDEITNDKTLKSAVNRGDFRTILNSPTVLRLLDDEALAEELERHQPEIIDAVIAAVPEEFRVVAGRELAKLKGVPVPELRERSETVLEEIRAKLSDKDKPKFEEAFEKSANQFGKDFLRTGKNNNTNQNPQEPEEETAGSPD